MHATSGIFGLLLATLLYAGAPAYAQAPPEPEGPDVDRTPPRLSLTQGQVSYWRPGAEGWAQAQVNTPVAPGDELYTGPQGSLELQIDGRAFVRGWASTQLGLVAQEPDLLRFKVTAGQVSFDLRTLDPGSVVEVNTPNAAITIEHPGYYRLVVGAERTTLTTRRAGRATLLPPGGDAVTIVASEEVIVEGLVNPRLSSYAAPPLDEWDRWNYARTERLLDAVSARYVPPDTYGASDLDLYGTWRVVPQYGSVWVPTAVPSGWVPYSTGSWILDPFFGWTWVDASPWGWAPFHYGRWVFVEHRWAWAPGPIVARPVYAPALVAFLGVPGSGGTIAIGSPLVGWVALGWGEPCVPWWGKPGFVHRPWWGGWGGPRIVNNAVVSRGAVVRAEEITGYRNLEAPDGLVAIRGERFGRGSIRGAHVEPAEARSLHPIHGAPPIPAAPSSFVPASRRRPGPPEEILRRPVVTRPMQPESPRAGGGERGTAPPGNSKPESRPAPPSRARVEVEPRPRPPFGESPIERPMTDRTRPPAPPQVDASRQPTRPAAAATGQVSTPTPTAPAVPATPKIEPVRPPANRPTPPRVASPQAVPAPSPAPQRATPSLPSGAARQPEGRARPSSLPGEPASRLSPRQEGARGAERPAAPGKAEHPESSRPERSRGGPSGTPREGPGR